MFNLFENVNTSSIQISEQGNQIAGVSVKQKPRQSKFQFRIFHSTTVGLGEIIIICGQAIRYHLIKYLFSIVIGRLFFNHRKKNNRGIL
jgi:hypothetical protein